MTAWSKLVKRLDALRAPSLADRVRVRSTLYRAAHDQLGRGTLLVDGEEIWSFCQSTFQRRRMTGPRLSPEEERARGLLGHEHFTATVERYPDLALDDALAEPDMLVRALALIDRRLGKRRLRALDHHELRDHPALDRLYRLRCEVEGVAFSQNDLDA